MDGLRSNKEKRRIGSVVQSFNFQFRPQDQKLFLTESEKKTHHPSLMTSINSLYFIFQYQVKNQKKAQRVKKEAKGQGWKLHSQSNNNIQWCTVCMGGVTGEKKGQIVDLV